MSSVLRQRQSLMFRARSYTAFAIAPQPPLQDWLTDLDATLERSKGFFSGQPVALDLSAVNLSAAAITELVADLEKRNVCVLGIEGIDPAKWQAGLPPVLRGGRGTQPFELSAKNAAARSAPGRYPASSAEAAAGIAPDRGAGALGAIRGLYGRRHYRSWLGWLGRRNHRGRLDPCLRRTARPRPGRCHRRRPRADLLPQRRGRVAGHRFLLQDGRRYRGQPAPALGSGLA